jgi:hypothetical protein
MYVDERSVGKSAIYSDYAETLVDWCKVFNHEVKLRIHKESCSKFLIIGKAAGIDGIDLFHLVFWIAAIAILYFLSSLIVQ